MNWLLLFLFSFQQNAVSPETYIGQWRITGGSVIEIYTEYDMFYGKIKKRSSFPIYNRNGLDNKNPDSKLRTRKIVGMVILKDLCYANGVLKEGTIYNADSGKTYKVQLSIDKNKKDELKVKVFSSSRSKSFKARRVK